MADRDETTSPPAAVARGLTLAYGPRVAVQDASFELPTGRLTAIIGPNGSGKTTVLRALGGLVAPTAGTLEVLGRPAGAGSPQVAHVLQATRINDTVPLTVREVVTMGRYAHRGMWRPLRDIDHHAVDEAMARMDVADLARRQVAALSGGQRQRVYVAQGLAQEARLLLLDEPVTGLDAPSLGRIRAVVREELARGRSVVVTTHDVAEAGRADHVLLLATELVACGRPEEVLTQDHLATAYQAMTFTTTDGTVVIGDPHIHGTVSHRDD